MGVVLVKSRRALFAVLVAGLIVAIGACSANPPPPVRETAPPATPAEYPTEKTIYIATDSVGGGFNPHIGADQGTVTTAVAAMTLPSAFRPVDTPGGVVWQRQEALITSAEVTSTEPFTVTYQIHNDAQWSDGLPVTGDDFSYLWQQMSRQPNVVAPAGYRLIDSVQSRAGGKEVQVTFARPYPAWRELFTDLLPSHVLRGAPAGFQTGMDSGKPVSAGPYSVVSIDQTRDEVRLVRNDRYWMKPPDLDQVVLRRAGTASQMVESVRSGDSSVVTIGAGPATTAELTAVPGVQTRRNPTSRALSVSVNARTSTMRSLDVRRAVLGMIDPNLVTLAGAGDDIVTPYANTVFAPTDRGYFPVDRPRPSPDQVTALLTDAGYKRAAPDPGTPASPSGAQSTAPSDSSTGASGSDSSTAGDGGVATAPLPAGVTPYRKDGETLTVRVGAISGDPRSTSAAANIVDQLRGQGVQAAVVALPNSELYGVALTNARVDLVVGWTGLGVPPAAALASQVDCDQPKPGTAPSLSTPPTPTSVAPGQTGATAADSYASNISGVCDPALIGLARGALSAVDPVPQLTEAEPLLAAQSTYLPIYQDSMLAGRTGTVRNVPLTGPIQVSIFGDAVSWELP
ncbi:ABC transporter family substrate-binding protein [Gordonia insulae]|uniref:Putative monoacyl phosphatidylinositol tetramannoside-binding protein LpqW n=1 Tax=Gordonia insulae TaxID=2420509 RepID=A0A3G8JUI4_9ACTN|nr:ABC transporter family substrate-binding protein [Gordonia insulae]AZG48737.1 putative monoacyl phosphatidylinositol tetramannoside-binding protein LpqW [Gordonia insulae]